MQESYNNNIAPQSIGLYWDQLWRQLYANEKPALWDVPPSLAIAQDYRIFQSAFNPDLPVLDIGCGSGIQTGFLGSFYPKVFGIDASKKAIQAAQKLNKELDMTFVLINMLDKDTARSFNEKTGDANIYMRGVLHQIPLEYRPDFVNNLKLLMGETGTIYLIETAPNIQAYIKDLSGKFSELPNSLKRVMTSHFPPLGVSLDEIQQWFAPEKYEILMTGKSSLHTNLSSDDDQNIELPSVYALIRNQNN